ncbi:hemerythrin domain-containing protein [Actinoplanes derwentensis]|uniref:Rho termination factor, N-terminal domain n=1 Tax=Actinoplanes derwentensis TaxID=113562 RepID=A0A1H2AGR8_9ACTN|nr:hemerythrin domain-containing protein [Actinoplanes derwentensis]GID90254.1 hemerythrin [Actinoplanes derwentensis]SDT45215.1 Rho termination factor, N-terminal domain [Actinoplanes derwentensis]
MPDIVEIIKEQHRQVDDLLTRAEQDGADRAAIMQEVARLLLPHSEAEEAFVYPRIRDLAAEAGEEVRDGTAEHHQVEEMLTALLRGDSDDPGYDGTIAAIAGELRHHVQEEEEDLLPVLAGRLDTAEREEMGRRFAEATTGGLPEHASTRRELYDLAREQDVPGRSRMNKQELAEAVGES